MKNRLAIVIPAYKITFLSSALQSIADQTCQDFTLYVGDDCSPDDIKSVVDKYTGKTHLVYHRFEENLGGTNLVAQWERCIALTEDEEYIWLFSDDDILEPCCVEELLKQIDKTSGKYDLYHFDVNEINERGAVVARRPAYPSVFNAYDFYKGKVSVRYRSYVVENVFSRKVYQASGGFKKFDLAWGSDVATWCIFCGDKGMCKVPNGRVNWRRSSENITPNKTKRIAERKLMADCAFMAWAYEYFKEQEDIYWVNRKLFITKMQAAKNIVSKSIRDEAFITFFHTHGHHYDKPLVYIQAVIPNKLSSGLYKLYRFLARESHKDY